MKRLICNFFTVNKKMAYFKNAFDFFFKTKKHCSWLINYNLPRVFADRSVRVGAANMK